MTTKRETLRVPLRKNRKEEPLYYTTSQRKEQFKRELKNVVLRDF